MTYCDYIRWQITRDAYEKMSPEERLALAEKSRHTEIMSSLQGLRNQLDKEKYSFTKDLLANITGNVITNGAVWIGSKLIKAIK